MFKKVRMFIMALLIFLAAGNGVCLALPSPAGELNRAQTIEKLFANRQLDVIEGIWITDGGTYEIAITKNIFDLENYKPYEYVGLVIHNTTGVWKPGELKLALKKTAAEKVSVGIWYGHGSFGKSVKGEATLVVKDKNVIEYFTPAFYPERGLLIRIYPNKGSAPAKTPKAASGTGFFVTKNVVVTNNHVIEGMSKIKVHFNGQVVDASVIGKDAANDVALLRVNGLEGAVTPLPLGNAKEAKQGNRVYAYGFPVPDVLGSNAKLTDGLISSLTGPGDDIRMFQISIPIQPGNSGGPLINDRGTVIGITSSGMDLGYIKVTGTLPQNINYAMKSTVIFNLIANLPDEISPERPPDNMPVLTPEQVVEVARKAVVFIQVTSE